MDKTGFLTQTLGDGADKGSHIMVCLLENLSHALVVAARHLYFGYGFTGNNAQLSPGVTDSNLHLQPLIKLVLI